MKISSSFYVMIQWPKTSRAIMNLPNPSATLRFATAVLSYDAQARFGKHIERLILQACGWGSSIPKP